jgi:hypothetical protein
MGRQGKALQRFLDVEAGAEIKLGEECKILF